MSAAAMEAGLSKSLVTKWKTNNVEVPSPDVLRKLSNYFGIPVSELLGEEKGEEAKKEKPTTQMDDGLSESQKALIEFAKTVPDSKAGLALRLLQSLEEAGE